ncbi:hypothetical protein [Allosphingosinicella deserti]|uniref:Uncharacterized protein n=1 Tax=Allosphingosinicella deserti TaxID=2116704 RepID=A0A2P7QE66_9SPHN|nr:hypothetical protein [Sphingomonas deserti]PSJ36268.1 hypothetical protein C7I55_27175 [Sphingomonas deserti]
MTSVIPWICKALLGAIYWLTVLYIATGIFFGDRLTPEGVSERETTVPLWLFAVLALTLYAFFSCLFDRLVARRSTTRDRSRIRDESKIPEA